MFSDLYESYPKIPNIILTANAILAKAKKNLAHHL
jgi:hypothetical protein